MKELNLAEIIPGSSMSIRAKSDADLINRTMRHIRRVLGPHMATPHMVGKIKAVIRNVETA